MKYILLLIAGLFVSITGYSQSAQNEVIATAGDYFTSKNNSMSWTLGECITETYSTKDNTLTQGFQQSTYTITAVNQLAFDGISVKAFPNPTIDYINVSVETTDGSQRNYSVELFDIQGKLLKNEKLNEKSMQLDMSQFANGTYFLKVTDRGKNMLQHFKILKN